MVGDLFFLHGVRCRLRVYRILVGASQHPGNSIEARVRIHSDLDQWLAIIDLDNNSPSFLQTSVIVYRALSTVSYTFQGSMQVSDLWHNLHSNMDS